MTGERKEPEADPGESATSPLRLPPWIRVRLPHAGVSDAVKQLLDECALHTVCRGAQCPNQHECFSRGTATFMILGGVCTRDCLFCAVRNGRPQPVDSDEPGRVAAAAQRLGLRYVVITSVTRDDLDDGGAAQFAQTVDAVRRMIPGVKVEVLVPDFQGRARDLDTVLGAGPDVLNHNLETVERLQRIIRPAASYEWSLGVLRHAANAVPKPVVKSGLMVGLGETDEEVFQAMADLRAAGCELLTIGQYLAPSPRHAPVRRYVHPDTFAAYARRGTAMGFRGVASGPLVRSSYLADRLFESEQRAAGPAG